MPGLYTHTTRATGTILTANIYNTDHQNHIDNAIPSMLDDYSANVSEMRTVADPGENGSESLATNIAGELARLRNIIKEISGKSFWYETPANSLASIATSIAALVGTTRTIIAGAGLTGGGDLSADRTLDVGAGAGITVAADSVGIDKASQGAMEASTADKVVTADNIKWHPTVAKAWCNFDGTGTPAIKNAGSCQFNVTAITDNGVGDWTVNFATAFSTANYGAGVSGPNTGNGTNVTMLQLSTKAAGSCRVLMGATGPGGGGQTDIGDVNFWAFGDQ